MTTDATPVRGSDAEPTEQELRDLAAEHGIAIPTRPSLGLVCRSRYDNLSDDLVAALVALAKAKDNVRYWMGRFDQAHDRAAEADLSATAARAAYNVATERAGQAEAERDQLKQHQEDAPDGTPHCTYSAAEHVADAGEGPEASGPVAGPRKT